MSIETNHILHNFVFVTGVNFGPYFVIIEIDITNSLKYYDELKLNLFCLKICFITNQVCVKTNI